MKLYTGDLSPYSAKVRMQIYAMGIEDDIEFEFPRSLLALFFQGKMKEFSPLGRIPVLEVDGANILAVRLENLRRGLVHHAGGERVEHERREHHDRREGVGPGARQPRTGRRVSAALSPLTKEDLGCVSVSPDAHQLQCLPA